MGDVAYSIHSYSLVCVCVCMRLRTPSTAQMQHALHAARRTCNTPYTLPMLLYGRVVGSVASTETITVALWMSVGHGWPTVNKYVNNTHTRTHGIGTHYTH